MPSLWKKQKGNRISRLVADLQTTPKRGGSLVVETGFPTSLIDLFVKNRDKLKKPKTKKHKSKKVKTVTEDDSAIVDDGDDDNDNEDDDNHLPKSVSNSSDSLSDLEVPNSSVAQKNGTQIDNHDVFVKKQVSHENHNAKLYHDSCKNDEGNEEKRDILEVSNRRNMVLFSMFIGVLVLIVVLYTKRWFLAFITLGFVLLLLLECVGNPVLRLFKPCENVISLSVLKGGLAVVVALYTKWFVVGITMGASLLLLLEYARNSGFGLFKPCQDSQWNLNGVLSKLSDFKQRRRVGERDERKLRGVLTRSGLIGSKRERKEVENEFVFRGDFDMEEVVNGGMSRKEVEPQLRNGYNSKMGTNLEDGDVVAKGVNEEGNGCSSSTYVNDNTWLLEENSRNKPMHELIALESNNSKNSRVSYSDLQGEKGRENPSEDSDLVGHKGKNKKGKKFWKKLVPKKKKKNKNKNKHGNGKEYDGASTDGIQEAELEEEEDEAEEGEQEISDGEGSLTLSSYEEDELGNDNAGVGGYTVMSELDNRTTACGSIKERHMKPRHLAIMMIPLTGLVGGRLFAVVLTVVCCLVFKMVRG